MMDFGETLATAERPSVIYERVALEARTRVACNGIHIMPLARVPDEALRSVVYLRDGDAEALREPTARAVQVLTSQPWLPNLFALPKQTLRLEKLFDLKKWLHSPLYQEHFRPSEGARQFVVGFADSSGAPRGFMAVCRGENEAPFSREEEELLVDVRDQAQHALRAFELANDWSRPAHSILDAISAALPVPALLLSGERIQWMNREAELRLEALGLTFGSVCAFAGSSAAIAELVVYVRRELERPGTAIRDSAAGLSLSWLLPGETIVVRRVDWSAASPSVLVCVCAATPPAAVTTNPSQLAALHGLSAREADVALLALEGFSVLAIAHRLSIAESTVSSHLKRVYRKLGVRSRAELGWRVLRRA